MTIEKHNLFQNKQIRLIQDENMKIMQNIKWRPSTVSWLSFVLMGAIVIGVGLSGTAHVINYLQDQLIQHSIDHNKEIATELAQTIEEKFRGNEDQIAKILSHAIEDYRAFGYQIFVISSDGKSLIEGNYNDHHSDFLSTNTIIQAENLDGSPLGESLVEGPVRVVNSENHPLLIWLQKLSLNTKETYLLGIAKDEVALSDYMSDLHLHLDAVLLLTYLLIAVLGYFSLRSIGRLYEKRLEKQLDERTSELEKAHKSVLQKTRLATIGQTASVLTHEMRNPLASIKLALSVGP